MVNIIKKATISILFIIISLFSIVITPFTSFAAVSTYSDVLDDLKVDTSFRLTDYPTMSYDHFKELNSDKDLTNDVDYISVIQIAESENNELFIYTYQPLNDTSDITASSITFATVESAIKNMDVDGATDFKKYSLACVSSYGPFKKYLVENFVVTGDYYRYYCISEIERPFDTILDKQINNETITNFKTHKVGQAWCSYYYNGNVKYEMVTLDVVEITPTLNGELAYENGVTWGSLVGIKSKCVSHYISFNIGNYEAERIIDASLEYKYRDYIKVHTVESGFAPAIGSLFGRDTEFTSISYPNGESYKTMPLNIYDTDIASSSSKGLFAKEYYWNRIMTGPAFVKQYEDQGGTWVENNKSIVENSEYVFAFEETEYSSSQIYTPGSDMFGTNTWTTTISGTEIAEVDILRLKFVSNGTTYNLGVVSDTTTSDGVFDGNADGLDIDIGLDNSLEKILSVILVVLLALVFVNIILPLVRPLFKTVIKGVSALLNLLTLPLQFIFKRK